MSTLLLRLAAPLQAWGIESKYDDRSTGREPSKSGVIGILAAALGRKRNADLSDLNTLRFGLRIDQEGQLLRDYHTVHGEKDAYVTNRYYLADACFLVGLEGDNAFLEELSEALRSPVFPLFLGRRSCPPDQPMILGIRETDLLSALRNEPWQASKYMQKKLTRQDGTVRLRMRVDAQSGESAARVHDVPRSFDSRHRQYGYRNVTEPAPVILRKEYDPMEELR